MAQKFAAGAKGGVPPFKGNEKIDITIAHWCLYGPKLSGMYETTRELITAENQIPGVLAGMCEVVSPNQSQKSARRAAQGGRVDPMHPHFRTQDYGWAIKFADIHVIHTSQLKRVGELKQKAFFLHGTPEACLEQDLQTNAKLKSYSSAMGYINKSIATFVTSNRAKYLWQPYDYTGERIHKVTKGIDLEWWQRTSTHQDLPGEPSVLYGEMWRGIKHPLHTIFAVNEIYEDNPDVKLNVWANNMKRELWKQIFDEGNFTKFLGPQGLRGIIDYPEHYYARGDVLVSPGLYGDASRVGQEAMACGCPVVAWDADPYGDTHPYKYAKSYSCSDLADKIMDSYNDVKDDPEKVQIKCRQIAQKYFDVNEEAKQVVDVLRNALSEL